MKKYANLDAIPLFGFTELATDRGSTGAIFFFFLAREVEKAVSTRKFHSQHLIFRTCGCTHGGAEDRKSTDPEKGNREL